jgi:hypothetical protein
MRIRDGKISERWAEVDFNSVEAAAERVSGAAHAVKSAN